MVDDDDERTRNGNGSFRFRFDNIEMIHFRFFPRENLPQKIFRVPSIFHGFSHEGFNREKIC